MPKVHNTPHKISSFIEELLKCVESAKEMDLKRSEIMSLENSDLNEFLIDSCNLQIGYDNKRIDEILKSITTIYHPNAEDVKRWYRLLVGLGETDMRKDIIETINSK